MPYRIFVDSAGTEWQVWDIVPRLSERRSGEHADRRVRIAVIPFADRREESRRLTETRHAILRGTYAQGWLCFESNKDKRRHTPIPEDWTTCSDERLEAYLLHGERVSGAHQMLSDFSAEEPLAETG